MNKSLRESAEKFREELIKNQTESEKIVKAVLKSLKVNYLFQHIVPTNMKFHILDFFIPEYDLNFEIDGDYHQTTKQRKEDYIRDQCTIRYNHIANVIRIKNSETWDTVALSRKIQAILESIDNNVYSHKLR